MLDPTHNDLLRGLSPPEQALVRPLLERREFKAGQTILHWGEPGNCLYVIESGTVCVALPNRGGGDAVVAQLGPGQIFGEMAILTGRPRSAEVRALVDVVAYSLSVSNFFRVAGRSPTILLNIGRVLAGRLGHMTRASNQRDRRGVVVLVGPVPMLVGSLIATNLVATLGVVSGRRSMLIDVPPPHGARLAGREWSPDLIDLPSGEETLAHVSRLQVGPVTLHAANLPEPHELSAHGGPEMVRRVLGSLARAVEFVVVNLCGPYSEASDGAAQGQGLLEDVLPLATRVCLVSSSAQIGSWELSTLLRRCQARAMPSATFSVIALSGDGAPPAAVRDDVRAALGVSACTILPGQADLLRDAARVEPPFAIRAPRLGASRTFASLAREVAGLRVGLALGSGAAKGVAHVGVVAALNRLDVPIDVVTGTSIGALVGAGIAQGMDMRQVEETMARLVDLWGAALKPVLPREAIFSARGLERIVQELCGDLRIDELPIPYGGVATDLTSGRPIYMAAGPLAHAVRASISIPLVFPPFYVGGHLLVDGFVTNPVPTQFARLLGADVVIASSLSGPIEESERSPVEYRELSPEATPPKPHVPNILDTYLRCADIMMSGRGERDSLSADLVLRPRLPQMSWREFQKGGPPMRAGERAVEEELAGLRELLPWLRMAL